jgi:hypothetical protein
MARPRSEQTTIPRKGGQQGEWKQFWRPKLRKWKSRIWRKLWWSLRRRGILRGQRKL